MSDANGDRKGVRFWQVAFIMGAVGAIASSLLLLGPSWFPPAVAALTTIITVLNALLSAPAADAQQQNWLISTLRRGLNASVFLKTSTIVIWCAVFGTTVFGLLRLYRESQKITVEGYVLTPGGDPADNAVISADVGGNEVTTVSSIGKFSFVRLDVSGLHSKQLPVKVHWRNIETTLSVDLSGGPPRDLIIRLPVGDPPFRISYFQLQKQAIDYLIRGQISKEWEERLGGKAFIIPNEVFRTLRFLRDSFNVRIEGEDLLVTTKSNGELSVKPPDTNRLFLVGTFRPGFSAPASDKDFILAAVDPMQTWRVGSRGQIDTSAAANTLRFWKFADRDDAQRFFDMPPTYYGNQRQWVSFYKYITRDYTPADFYFIELSMGCDELMHADFFCRVLTTRVAVLENMTSFPLRIGDFTLRKNDNQSLRSRRNDQATLSAISGQSIELFPQTILNAGEKLLIPLEISFQFEGFALDEIEELVRTASDPDERNRLTSLLSNINGTSLPLAQPEETFYIKSSDLLRLANKALQLGTYEKEYVFGETIAVESVEADKVKYPFRNYDPDKFVLWAGEATGSCPYLYTFSKPENSWLSEGTILYGLRGRNRESISERPLKRFDGRLVIKEEEPEESFIDYVSVKAIWADGTEQILLPKNAKLTHADRDYLKLTQGQQIEIDFEFPRAGATKYVLMAKGYYVTSSYGR